MVERTTPQEEGTNAQFLQNLEEPIRTSRAAKREAASRINNFSSSQPTIEPPASPTVRNKHYYLKHPNTLRDVHLNVWYPNENGAGGAFWKARVQNYCGRKRWRVVFNDHSFAELTIDQVMASMVSLSKVMPSYYLCSGYDESRVLTIYMTRREVCAETEVIR